MIVHDELQHSSWLHHSLIEIVFCRLNMYSIGNDSYNAVKIFVLIAIDSHCYSDRTGVTSCSTNRRAPPASMASCKPGTHGLSSSTCSTADVAQPTNDQSINQINQWIHYHEVLKVPVQADHALGPTLTQLPMMH